MTKLAKVTLTLLALCSGPARAEPLDGKPVPLFPRLTWGLDEQAALAKGLQTYTKQNTKVIGLPSITIGDIDFAAQAVFGKKNIGDVRSGLNYIVLRHEGVVPKVKYDKFVRLITNGFLYAGQASAVDELAAFYNAISRDDNLVITTSVRAGTSLSVAIAPGLSK